MDTSRRPGGSMTSEAEKAGLEPHDGAPIPATRGDAPTEEQLLGGIDGMPSLPSSASVKVSPEVRGLAATQAQDLAPCAVGSAAGSAPTLLLTAPRGGGRPCGRGSSSRSTGAARGCAGAGKPWGSGRPRPSVKPRVPSGPLAKLRPS
eukprot:6947141-Prymnesium_polylepis.1